MSYAATYLHYLMIPRCYVSLINLFSQRLYGPRYQKHQRSGDVRHVFKCGALLHRIPWPRGSPTYRDICLMYCDYVTRKYGQPNVVFDVYEEYTTKFTTHQKRAAGTVVVDVTFTDEMKLS